MTDPTLSSRGPVAGVAGALPLLALSRTRLLAAVAAGSGALLSATALLGVSAWLIVWAAQLPPVHTLALAATLVRALGVGRGVLRYLERLLSHDVALRGVVTLRTRVYQALADAPPSRLARLRRGDVLRRLSADLDALGDVVVRAVLPAVTALAVAVSCLAVVAAIHLPSAVPLAAGLLVAGVVGPLLQARAAAAAEREAAVARLEVAAHTLALLDAVDELRVAGAWHRARERLAAAEKTAAAAADRAAAPGAWAAATQLLGTGIAVVGAAVLALGAAGAGELSVTLAAVVVLLPLASFEATAALPGAATTWVRARHAATRVLDVVESATGSVESATGSVESATASADSAAAIGAARSPHPAGARQPGPATEAPLLSAQELSCGWPGAAAVLRDVDLAIGGPDAPTGVAVVGVSGSGKSTLLATLAGLLPPRAGRALVAGVPPSADDERRREQVCLVGEADHVFATSLRENLRLARPGADDAELVAAVERVRLGPWLRALPAGLDTLLGSGGSDVSGGERRRLLLARAALSPAAVLCVDEPGEHLDPATADALVTGLLTGELTGGRPCVVATHRLTPLAAAGEVVVLRGGRVAARGRHDELLAVDPRYAAAVAAEQPEQPGRPIRITAPDVGVGGRA